MNLPTLLSFNMLGEFDSTGKSALVAAITILVTGCGGGHATVTGYEPSDNNFESPTVVRSATYISPTGATLERGINVEPEKASALISPVNDNPLTESIRATINRATTISWTAPIDNEDGSPAIEITGYRIYYGTSTRVYSKVVDIRSPDIKSYQVDGLNPGTYYFSLSTIGSGGESVMSSEVVKVIR